MLSILKMPAGLKYPQKPNLKDIDSICIASSNRTGDPGHIVKMISDCFFVILIFRNFSAVNVFRLYFV